ncbi:Similar to D-arabinitol 2-dehydrogenase [ribulose-forming]; acc. no. P50166 [Pyronema omphalodes CBS 100304]|uniref:Similar to D-arabinitol 2-dehydrogenase [ribulose-forming] acc. no. P50166 n=1 Tax=Pyronema omphalodes (strain CBS 100304) TaxID=1076935 RepID=U4KYC2_PYROM|nr:Similar to D-arabinitol 2-dehydrogenase [ribulose-forming]; acc. no. P50166 [Pyronema omphalodes CBS 100304]
MIAAAGIIDVMDSLEVTKKQFQKVIEMNTVGAFLTAQAAAREMVRLQTKGGSILLIASLAAKIASRGMPNTAYCFSKAAVAQMGRSLASEWGRSHGITVNKLCPGAIMTDMVKDLLKVYPEKYEEWSDVNMMGRMSEPEEFKYDTDRD